MQPALSTKTAHRYTPIRMPGEVEVTYLLEPPTRLKRIHYRQRVAELSGRVITREELERAFARALLEQQGEALASPVLTLAQAIKDAEGPSGAAYRRLSRALRGRAAATTEEEIAAADKAVEAAQEELQRVTPKPEDVAALQRAEDAVVALDEPYRTLKARFEAQQEIALLAGIELFLIGWEGLELPFRREQGRLPEDLLERLPGTDIVPLGLEVRRMLWLDQAAEKNSASPSH